MHFPPIAIAFLLFTSAGLGNDAVLMEGRERSHAFLEGDLVGIWADMTPELQGLFGSIAGFETFRAGAMRDFGEETQVLSEEVQPSDGLNVYLRTSTWSLANAPVVTQWTIADSEQIASFSIQVLPTLADSRFLDYQTKVPLRLPFDGEWFVVWGGRTLDQNYHAANGAQRFAVDLLIYRGGATYRGDRQVKSNYYCWDQPILAPAGGTVVGVVNDLPDNNIGATDADNPAGNHVVIDFGNSEFGFLAHMREGSVTVASGDTVIAGQELGRCGNSGNTSEPHLHFHLQNTSDLTDGEGLPAFFEGYIADDHPTDRGEPIAGQYIRPE